MSSVADHAACPLSQKDIELVKWASYGKTAEQIALITGATHASVRTRLFRAAEKAGAVNAPSLVAMALRNHWIE